MEFIYHGEVSIDQECLPGFLHAAESLRIKGLTQDKKVNPRGYVVTSTYFFFLQNKEDPDKVENNEGQQPEEKSTTLIHKALKKLMNGVNLSEPEDRNDQSEVIAHDNNNDQLIGGMDGSNIMEQEEEEEALSESEIRDSNLKNLDFQTMYQSFMSGSVSEDSDGSKDPGAGVNEDGSINFNLGDSNSPMR